MSSKREEAKAFKKLCKAFPGKHCSLNCQYQTWDEKSRYYCTVNGVGCNIHVEKYMSVSESVDDFIHTFKRYT